MKVKDALKFMGDNQNVIIMPSFETAAGMYRYPVKDVPPTLLNSDVVMVFPHNNGKEVVVEVNRYE